MSYRQLIKEFLAENRAIMGDIEVVTTNAGEVINLKDMSEEDAQKAAEVLFTVGLPTRLGALAKSK